jgi:hypothetical protein
MSRWDLYRCTARGGSGSISARVYLSVYCMSYALQTWKSSQDRVAIDLRARVRKDFDGRWPFLFHFQVYLLSRDVVPFRDSIRTRRVVAIESKLTFFCRPVFYQHFVFPRDARSLDLLFLSDATTPV